MYDSDILFIYCKERAKALLRFRLRSTHFLSFELYRSCEALLIAKQFKYYADCSVTLNPATG
jgi:hypothetical protein